MIKKILLIIYVLILSSAVFAQEPGVRYELNSINFKGNDAFSSSTLQDVIYSEETPWWFWKFLNSFTSLGKEPVYFDSNYISIDLKALKEFYTNNGFFEAKVSYNYDVDTADAEVNLNYIINENDPAINRNLTVLGIDTVPEPVTKNFNEELTIDTTQRYSQTELEKKIQSAISVLLNNGYMLANFDSTVVWEDTSVNRADLRVFFSPNTRYKIDTVIVNKKGEGAGLVKENLLRDITGIKTGEYYNLEKIRNSQVRLFRTGLFNSVILTSIEDDTSGNRVPLKLEGNIGLLNELSPEIIVNNQQNAFNVGLGFTYIRKNFLGNARKFTFSNSFGVQDIFNADISNLIKKFSFRDTTLLGYVDSRITIEQPYLFSKPIFGKWENYATIQKQQRYNNTVYGSKLTFEFELPRYTFINILSTYYNIEQSNEVYRTLNDSLSSKILSAIGGEVGSNTTDNILFPTRGYILTLQLEEANSLPYLVDQVSGRTYEGAIFYRAVLNNTNYWAFDRKRNNIFATKLKLGYVHAFYGDYSGIPINRTFYAGGSNSVRGWRTNQLVPKGTPVILGVTTQNTNVKGGTFLLEGSFEVRFRYLENFGTVFFTDYGNTWLGYQQFRYDEVALDAGIGLRYYTKIAPFRLDFAYKIYNPENKDWIVNKPFWGQLEVHFGIGEAF